MKHCALCDVFIDSKQEFCPLCHNALSETSKKDTPETFPKYSKEVEQKKTKRMVTKVFLILSLAIIVASACINIMTKTIAWSVIVSLGIVYLWVLVAHTIISRDSPFKKVLFQVLSIIAFLTSTNLIFGGNAWLTNYVYPSFAMFVTTVLTMIIFCSKSRKKILFGFFVILVMLALVSGIFLIFKIDSYQNLNIINLLVQGFMIFAYLLFGGKIILTQAARKFHI